MLAVVCSVLSSGLSGRLATRGFQNPNSDSAYATKQIQRATGTDPEATVVALIRPGGKITDPAARKRIAAVAKTFSAETDMGRVITPFDRGRTNAELISTDGKSVLVVGQLKPGHTEGKSAIRLIDRFATVSDVELGGGLIAQRSVSVTVENDLRRAELIAFPLLFLLSLILFRGLIAASLPLLVGGLTIPLTFAVISLADKMTDLSVFALSLTTGLGLGLAIDYSLLLVTRFREELGNGRSTPESVRTTVATAGRTIVFSALTVAGSLAVLTIFPLKFLYSMGIAGASVALVAAAVALALIPAMLALLGPRINSLSLSRRPFDSATARWRGLAQRVMRHAGFVAITTTALLLLCGLPAMKIAFTAVDATVLPVQTGPYKVEIATRALFPRSQSTSALVAVVTASSQERADLALYAQRAAKLGTVSKIDPPLYLGKNTWRIDVFPKGTRYSDAAQEAVSDLRALPSNLKNWDHPVLVGSSSAFFVDQRLAIVDHVPLALLMIGIITFIVLFLMTGSVILPLKTFVMNLLTLSATFGLLVLIFQDGRFEGPLDYRGQNALEMTQPVLLFAVAFGLATDYGVMLLSRIKEFHDHGSDNSEAVVEGVARTGRVITAAALLFCVAIGSFATSQIVFIKVLGVGSALAVAIDATIVRALLVPALMALLGKYNWWAPGWIKRLHSRIGLSESSAR